MSCKWDRDKADYLTDDGEPCRRDDYGDPTHHCTARRSCSQHIASGELTCARCVGRTRADVRTIRDFSALMPTAALAEGVNSEAANLAGPATDTEAWSWRKIAAKQGGSWHVSLLEEDDEHHPYLVLTRWEFMLREDYRAPRDTATSVTEAADYLDRNLHRIAQDDGQDFPLFAREIRTCRQHVESVLHNSTRPERGYPCPTCVGTGTVDPKTVRLACHFGHWCESEACEKIHHATSAGDTWVCPRNRAHVWTESEYRNYVEERKATA